MATHRYLANAPITEALIDFRAVLAKPGGPEWLPLLKKRLGAAYPNAEEGRRYKVRIEGKPPPSPVTEDEGFHGHLLKSQDGLNIAQFRVDGFTFNRLKPYTTWENVLSEARELWALYTEIAAPRLVSRVALRYINHLKLPLPIGDISAYLVAPPAPPPGAPKDVTSFLTRLVVRDAERGLAANIVQALEPGVEGQSATAILDIDAYKNQNFDPHAEAIWSVFEALREMKNKIFFGSITEDAARLYE